MLSLLLLMLNGLATAVGINLLQSRLERWDYDRHFQDWYDGCDGQRVHVLKVRPRWRAEPLRPTRPRHSWWWSDSDHSFLWGACRV